MDKQDSRIFPGPGVGFSGRTAYGSDQRGGNPWPPLPGSRGGVRPRAQRGLRGSAGSLATPTSCPIPGLSRSPLPVNRMLRQFSPRRPPVLPGSLARPQASTGDGQGAPGGWPGRCRAPVGAGRTRLPSVEETRPCGDGCQGRSFTPEAVGAATAVSAHRELSLSPPPAASLHPARWRTEEKGGRMNPLGIPGRARTGPGRRASFLGSLPALLGSRAAGCG